VVVCAEGALQIAPWQVVIASVLIGYTASRLLRRACAAARFRHECAALTAALRGIVRELRAGVPPGAAMDFATADAAPETRQVLQAIALPEGAHPAGALREGAQPAGAPPDARPRRPAAVPAGVVEQIRQAWAASLAHGIPLAAVLAACVADLDDRAAVAQLRAQHVAGPAVSGYVLAALPAAGIAMGAGMGSQPVDVLLGSTLGGALLVAGVALCCAGLLWTGRIVGGGYD
jgi:tight adherence protein B